MIPILNTTSMYQPIIGKDENTIQNSLFHLFIKIVENELINKISNFDALIKFIDESKDVLDKISYANDANLHFTNGEGFLHLMTQLDTNEEIIDWLRNLTYNFPELLNQQDNDGWTPIHFAIKNDKESLINLYIEMKCDLKKITKYETPPLLLAVNYSKISTIDLLISAGADVSALNIQKKGFLHFLCNSKIFFENETQKQWLRNIIQKYPNLLNQQDEKGITPLHNAIHAAKESLISLFIEMKCDLEIKSKLGKTPLLFASYLGQTSTIDLLIKSGSNIAVRDNYGNGILSVLLDVKDFFNNDVQILWLKKLIKNFPEILNSRDNNGFTPLHEAILMERESLISVFIEMNCDLEIRTNLGLTPLLLACSEEKMSAVDLLIDSGADVSAHDNYGSGILYFLSDAKNFHEDNKQISRIENIVKRFPEWLNNENKPDCIFMKLAATKGNTHLVDFLIQNGFFLDNLSAFLFNKLEGQIISKPIDYQTLKIHQKTIIPKLEVYLFYKSQSFYLPTNISEGVCQGLTFLFAYYLSRGKEEEFYQSLEEIRNWDEEEESLKQPPTSTIVSQVYSTLEDLFKHWINDILFFQLENGKIETISHIDFVGKYNFVKKDDSLQPFRANYYDLIVQNNNKSISVEKFDYIKDKPFTKKYVINSEKYLEKFFKIKKDTNNFFSIGLKEENVGHVIGIHVSSERIVTFYDSIYPYRIAPFKLTESSLEVFSETIESYIKIAYEFDGYNIVQVDHYIFSD